MKGERMDSVELRSRTKAFALRVIKVVQALPRDVSGRAIGAQLIRSGTSVGANYRAALRARSRKEFAARIAVVVEEADETQFWLELLAEGGILPEKKLQAVRDEAGQLTAIFTSIRQSVGRQKPQA